MVEEVVPGTVGVLVLGDSVTNGRLPGVAVGLVLAVGACVVLALNPADRAAEGELATGAAQAADAG